MSNLASYRQIQLNAYAVHHLKLWNGWSAAEVSRSRHELWLVLGGGAYLTVGERTYRLQKGDLCVLPDILPKEHGCDEAEHFELLVIDFKGTLLSRSLFEFIRCTDWVVHLDCSAFETLCELFRGQYNDPTVKTTLQRTLHLNRCLYTALELFFARTQVTELLSNDWLGDTLRYIDAHCEQKLSIELLAKRVAMHPKHFARCFSQKTGTSPGKHIAAVRLERAVRLLYEGNSLQEISERIGFQSIQQFFRFFKKHTGMTPREYQRHHTHKGGL